MALRTKRIYEPPEPGDGHRLLIMRIWPRGIRKEAIDEWDRLLAPSRELLADFRSGAADWTEYSWRFSLEMAASGSSWAIGSLRRRVEHETVTLLCWCPDESRCHRSLLREVIAHETR